MQTQINLRLSAMTKWPDFAAVNVVMVRVLPQNLLSLKGGKIRGFHHDLDKAVELEVDRLIRDAGAAEFDAVHLPGGTVNADKLRMVPDVQAFLMRDAGGWQAYLRHLSRAVGTGIGWIGAREDVDQLSRHPRRYSQRGRPLGGQGSGRGRQLGDQPEAGRFAGVQPRHDQAVFPKPFGDGHEGVVGFYPIAKQIQ
jgi:hypothetical protein